MAKDNSEYWAQRIADGTWKTYNTLEEKNRELLDFYTDASKAVKDELYALAEKHSKDGVLTLSEMHKQDRLTELNSKYEQIAMELGKQSEKMATKNMQDGFREVYRNTAVGLGGEDYAMPNKKLMEKLLNEPWRGDSFSGRLWKNQKRLAGGLNDILLTGLQQGKTVTEIAVNLHNFMGQGFNDCHRLVRTETMHYLNSATMQRYKDADVQYVQIWAAQDERTCEVCGSYHGKVYPADKCPMLPFHANCRCTIIPCLEEKLIQKYVDKQGKDDIIKLDKKTNVKGAVDVHIVGKIDKDIYKCITNDIVTDEVIITDTQVKHILERHPDAYKQVLADMKQTVENPDYIIADDKHKNTGLVIKNITTQEKTLQLVLRICTTEDEPGYKNSVISCWNISDKRLKNYLRNKQILYKHE